ncbi:MAG: helix-turn-helix transcriptional regulator [Deltaproteobacteria bacterium]|nr:helix-turn-helix transcriptional regulator [Deltaproteobacteria bacterium]
MVARIMMSVCGRTRPLALSSARNAEPLLNSAVTSWAGLPLETHLFQTVEANLVTGPVKNEHGILVIMSGKVDIVTRNNNREARLSALPGTTYLLSGNYPLDLVRMAGNAEATAVHIPNEWFGRLLLDNAPDGFGKNEILIRDQSVFSLVRAMHDEIASGSATGRLYSESLSTALLSYILERLPSSCFHARGRLSGAQCRRLQRYIRDHLHDDLSLTDLASVARLSTRHFSTLFREAFGITPHQYVLSCRLEEGARLLASDGLDIVDIALRLGFSSQSHFAAAFHRAYGITPKRYAMNKRKNYSIL